MQQNEAMNIVLTERLADIDLKTGACRCYNNIIIVRPSTCQKERNDYNSNHNFKSKDHTGTKSAKMSLDFMSLDLLLHYIRMLHIIS